MLKKFAKSSSFEYLVTTRRMLYLSNILFLVKRIPCKSLTSTKFRTESEKSRHDCGVSSPAQSAFVSMVWTKHQVYQCGSTQQRPFPGCNIPKILVETILQNTLRTSLGLVNDVVAAYGTCSVNIIISYCDLTVLFRRTTILCQTTNTHPR